MQRQAPLGGHVSTSALLRHAASLTRMCVPPSRAVPCARTPARTLRRAHTCVLASSSDYFRELFTGPWRTQVADDGKLRTQVSADVLRGVLSFVYVGEIDPALVDAKPEEIFSVAQQYFLLELAKLAEARLLDRIGVDTLKGLLVLADRHEAATLKQECFAFVRQNKVSSLTSPDMMKLATEQPALWAEIVEVTSANEPAKKRPRT